MTPSPKGTTGGSIPEEKLTLPRYSGHFQITVEAALEDCVAHNPLEKPRHPKENDLVAIGGRYTRALRRSALPLVVVVLALLGIPPTPMFGASPANAGTILYGIVVGGDVIHIDKATGTGTLIGNSGFEANAAASDSQGRIFTAGGSGLDADRLVLIDPITGSGSVFLDLTNRPGGVRGMAFDSQDNLFVVVDGADASDEDLLATIDAAGVFSVIGGMSLSGVQGLAFDPDDNLFCVDVTQGLCAVDVLTGAATVIGGSSAGLGLQGLEFDIDGTLFASPMWGDENLRILDPTTGDASIVGLMGFSDIRGLTIVPEPSTGLLLFLGLSGLAAARRRSSPYGRRRARPSPNVHS